MTPAVVESHFRAAGFAVESTGGNCEAFIRYVDPDEPDLTAHILVTNDGDAALPETMDEPVLVGFYDSAGHSITMRFPSARAFLAALQP